MFQLDNEIALWVKQVLKQQADPELDFDELSDHLHCEVEFLQASGWSAQSAFEHAKKQLGEIDILSSELVKTREHYLQYCYFNQLRQLPANTSKLGAIMKNQSTIHALIWAAAILTTSVILKENEAASEILFSLMTFWLASFIATNQFKKARSAECAFFKRMAKKFSTS